MFLHVGSPWVMMVKNVSDFMYHGDDILFSLTINTAGGVDSSRNVAGVALWGQGDKIR